MYKKGILIGQGHSSHWQSNQLI